MKCPKCDYLGFETGDRCKNCGYDFSLLASPQVEPVDLSLKSPEPEDAPMGDLWLGHSNATPQPSAESQDTFSSIESFPLFSPAGTDDEPLIRTPSEPRAPLAVRRSSELSRVRSASRTPRAIDAGLTLEFAEEPPVEIAPPVAAELVTPIYPEPIVETPSRVTASSTPSSADSVASLSRRALAALIDHAILFGIDVFVFFSTLRMTALTTDEWRSLPLLPFLAFLLFMKLSYFSAFTAMGGQTIGKMAARIRVVADDQFMMDPARAIKRTLTGVVSLATLGLGLIPALIAPDRRAFHDRVAHTHVVDLPSA